ncbi:MAG: Cof-type HAD-IIB family hydrolase [Bacillota bacterium]|nr:Cof-type HAD-IIB family hydrolase [Bacillota bacterium]
MIRAAGARTSRPGAVERLLERWGPELADIRLVVSDMDGTLLDRRGEVPPATQAAVAALRAAGLEFTLVSGRPPYTMFPTADLLELDLPFISYNGGLIVDREGRTLDSRPLDPARIEPLVRRAADYGFEILIGTPEDEYTILESPWVVDRRKTGIYRHPRMNIEDLHRHEILKCEIIGYRPPFQLRPEGVGLLEAEAAPFAGDPGFIRYENIALEIMGPGVSKATGLEHLLELLGLTAREVLAIGDNTNDNDMLAVAGLGMAVQNASPGTIDAADYHLEGFFSDGVCEVLEALVALRA